MPRADEALLALAREVTTDVITQAVLARCSDEVMLSWMPLGGERHVRTEGGVRMYHAPVGTPITERMRDQARRQSGKAAEQAQHDAEGAAGQEADEGARDLPPVRKGAAAIYPNLGRVGRAGDTLSRAAYRGQPRPQPPLPEPGSHPGHFGITPESGKPQPFTDEEYRAHYNDVETRVSKALAAGKSTDKSGTVDGNGQVWNPDRAAVHNEIVKSYVDKAAKVPSEGKGLIAGGLGGAGKSTVLSKHAGVDQSKYVTLNPDDIKEQLAERGMVPKVAGLSPMEASVLVHEEASHITNLIAQQMYSQRKNVIWDITMSSPGSVQRRLDQMHAAGYHQVQSVFVHIPVETSVTRAQGRHRRGADKFRRGEGFGGRFVPAGVIRASAREDGSNANRETFEKLKPHFSGWQLWDNSGTEPTLVERGGHRAV